LKVSEDIEVIETFGVEKVKGREEEGWHIFSVHLKI
jgi:hypothetical protein